MSLFRNETILKAPSRQSYRVLFSDVRCRHPLPWTAFTDMQLKRWQCPFPGSESLSLSIGSHLTLQHKMNARQKAALMTRIPNYKSAWMNRIGADETAALLAEIDKKHGGKNTEQENDEEDANEDVDDEEGGDEDEDEDEDVDEDGDA